MNTGFLERADADKVAEELRTIWDLERTWAAFDEGRPVSSFRSFPTGAHAPGPRARGRLRHRRGERPARLPPPRHPPPDDGRRAHRRAGSRRGRRAAVRRRVPDLRPVRLRPGVQGGGLVARRGSRPVPRRDDGLHRDRSDRRGRTRHDRRCVRGVARALGRRDRPPVRTAGTSASGSGPARGARRGRASSPCTGTRQARSTATCATTPRSTGSDASRGTRCSSTTCTRWTPQRTQTLWRFLAGIDWAGTVKAERRHPSEPLPWLLVDGRAALLEESGDGAPAPPPRRPAGARGEGRTNAPPASCWRSSTAMRSTAGFGSRSTRGPTGRPADRPTGPPT